MIANIGVKMYIWRLKTVKEAKMKKRLNMLVIILLVFVLTGCARINIDINVKENGKVDMSMLYAFMEAAANGTDMLSDYEIKELTDEGWEYAEYKEDGYVGYTLTVKDKSIEDLLDEVEDSNNGLDVGESFSIKLEDGKYIFDCDLLGGQDTSEIAEYKEYFTMYGGYMTVVLHVPEPAIDSNATSVSDDGKTLTWDLLEMRPGEKIHAEFKMSVGTLLPIIIFSVIGFLVILTAILLVIFLGRRAKKKKEAAGADAQAAAGVYPAGDQANAANSNPATQMNGSTYVYGYQSQPQPQMAQPATQPQAAQPVTQAPPVQQAPAEAVPMSQNKPMSFCPQCGAKLAAPSAYCPQCGTKLL